MSGPRQVLLENTNTICLLVCLGPELTLKRIDSDPLQEVYGIIRIFKLKKYIIFKSDQVKPLILCEPEFDCLRATGGILETHTFPCFLYDAQLIRIRLVCFIYDIQLIRNMIGLVWVKSSPNKALLKEEMRVVVELRAHMG